MSEEKLPPLPPLPPLPESVPPPPPPKRSKSGAFKHLKGISKDEKLQDFARTGFAGYKRVVVTEKRRTPRILWTLFGLFLGAVAIFVIYEWARPATVEDVALGTAIVSDPATLTTTTRIDPGAWRGDVEAVESLLFARPSEIGPLGSFGVRFEEEAGSFARHLRTNGGAKELALAAELDDLVAATARSDFNVRRLKEVRNSWLSLRDARLDSASWLRREEDVSSRVADLDVYRDAAEQIQDLLADTLSTAEDLSSSDMVTSDRDEEWRRTLFYFRDDLKVLRASLPRRPGAGAPAAELDAIHQLDRLFISSRDLADRNEDLDRFRSADFESALDNADEATAFFDRRLSE